LRRFWIVSALCLGAACAPSSDDSPRRAAQASFASTGPDQIADGARIAAVLGCNGCHGKDLTGQDWSDEHGILWTANLTRTVAAVDDPEFVRLMQSGRRHDRDMIGMPSHLFTQLADEDIEALLAFVRSKPISGEVHPEPTFSPMLREMMQSGKMKTSAQEVAALGTEWPRDAGPAHLLGRYISRATCAECHGMDLRGGEGLLPGDTPRPDIAQMIPAYSLEDFRNLMRQGTATGGRDVGLMSEVARNRYAKLTDDEIAALYDYLKALAAAGS
jgi:cytochrome c553